MRDTGGYDFIAIDFETATCDRHACQIGLIVVRDGKITERISRLIQPPGNAYAWRCVNVHGITPEQTANEPTFDIVWEDIKDYFDGSYVVAHNAPFDRSVLEKALEYYGLQPPRIQGFICTYKLSGLNLETACKVNDIPLCNHHDGVCDAEACAQLFLRFLRGELIGLIRKNSVASDVPDKPRRSCQDTGRGEGGRPVWTTHDRMPKELKEQDLTNADPSNPFYDKQMVITGVFDCIDRQELRQRLHDMGAKLCTSISRHTEIVVIGEEPGPAKLLKLQELKGEGVDITLVFEAELVDILSKY